MTTPATGERNAARVLLKCQGCHARLAEAWADDNGAIEYSAVHPVSFRFSTLDLEELFEGPIKAGIVQFIAAPGQDRVRFRAHRRCRATPTVGLSWLDQQVKAAIATGQSTVSLGL